MSDRSYKSMLESYIVWKYENKKFNNVVNILSVEMLF